MKLLLLPMAIFLLFALFFVSSAMDVSNSNSRTEKELNSMYESWLVKHGKLYSAHGEKAKRFQIFKDNLRYIEHHNSGNHSYKLGLNKFADLTIKEFQLRHGSAGAGAIPHRKLNKMTTDRFSRLLAVDLPSEVDWRNKGAVTAVKNQQQCDASWAFSAIGAVEGINAIVTGELIALSEQQLMDCDKINHGCEGGSSTDAFDYIIKNGGIDTEQHYPYAAEDGECKKNRIVVSIDSYQNVSVGDEIALQEAVAKQPVAAGIDTSEMSFQLYKSGVYNDASCGSMISQGVVVVGYGTTEDGEDYWLLKNSWGVGWGEEGYIKLIRNKGGLCGITKMASYPIKTP